MDATTESHHTSYFIPVGHLFISCLLFLFSCKERKRTQREPLQLNIKALMKKVYIIGFVGAN